VSTYRVYLVATASATVKVEADDPEQAIERAFEEAPGGLCYSCTRDYDIGDLQLSSEMFPEFNKPENDVELVEEES
jgi:hypothetical protein